MSPSLWALFVSLGLALLALHYVLPPRTAATVCVICAAVAFLVATILAIVPGLA